MPHASRIPFRHAIGMAILWWAGQPSAVTGQELPEPLLEAAGAVHSGKATSSGEKSGSEASLQRRFEAIAVRGAELREQGELEAALAVLERGHDEMLRQDKDGPGLQVYIDGLRLQAEYGMTLIRLGRLSLGEEFIATARKTVDLAYARRELGPSQEGASSGLAAAGLERGEALEMALARFYARCTEVPVAGLDMQLASERMRDAYRRAETWVLRKAMAGKGGKVNRSSAQRRVADIRLALARALLAAGRPQDAAAEFVAAAAFSCLSDGPPGHQGCTRATQGWAEATGAIGASEEAASRHSRWQEALGFDASLSAGPPDP